MDYQKAESGNGSGVTTTELKRPRHSIIPTDRGYRIGVGNETPQRPYEPVMLHGRASAEIVGIWSLLEGLAEIVAQLPGGSAARALVDETKAKLGNIMGGVPSGALDTVPPPPPPRPQKPILTEREVMRLEMSLQREIAQAEREAELARLQREIQAEREAERRKGAKP
ncbi:MAG: hypothetical protein JNJ59_15010 [Deltaproteobacteria bacterium]|nr:hypothetical protein [Deltaproteobacteria bacterium]